ncbi:hypothetical protein BST61_g6227 [Cercospora zeina]
MKSSFLAALACATLAFALPQNNNHHKDDPQGGSPPPQQGQAQQSGGGAAEPPFSFCVCTKVKHGYDIQEETTSKVCPAFNGEIKQLPGSDPPETGCAGPAIANLDKFTAACIAAGAGSGLCCDAGQSQCQTPDN